MEMLILLALVLIILCQGIRECGFELSLMNVFHIPELPRQFAQQL